MGTKSILSPLLWIAVPSFAFTIIGAYLMPDMRTLLVYSAIGLLVYVLLAYMYFALREPDRLQSEEFRIDSRRIELLGQQGSDIPVLDLQAEQVKNTYLPENTEEKAHGG
ncbi:hypothetical protein CO667_10130 [Rhizobium sp. L43]|nr:hypothetical protein CO667_10130 [Rhizobium sp. L43]